MKRFTVVIIALGIALSLFIFVGDRTADEPSSKVSTTTVFDEKQPNEMTVTVQSTAVTTSAPRSEEIKIRAKRIDVKKIVQFPEQCCSHILDLTSTKSRCQEIFCLK